MTEVPFRCACGTVRGHLTEVAGAHVVCHCRDCRAAEVALQQPDPGGAGVDLYQTTPDRVVFTAGADKLAVLRLSPKGPMRWYAACCNAPLFNTLPRPGLAFASLHVGRTDGAAALGPVVAEVNGDRSKGSILALAAGILWRTLQCRLSGRWRQTPFFRMPGGAPVAEPRVLTLAERRAATPAG